MATVEWIGNAKAVAQVTTVTASAANSTEYSLTINGKEISYTSDGDATAHDDGNFSNVRRAIRLRLQCSARGERRGLRRRSKKTDRRGCRDEKGSPTSYWISHQFLRLNVIARIGRGYVCLQLHPLAPRKG